MSYANGTTHYNLPQTVGTDKRDWFDTNSAFADVDAALYAAATGQAADAEAISTLQGTVSDMGTDITNLQTTTGNHTNQIGALQTSVGGLVNTVADVRQDAEDMISAYNEGAAETSTHAYAIGDYFIYNDVLYKATAAIAIGDTIVPNTNCQATNVTTQIKALESVTDKVGDLTTLTTTDKSSAVAAINEVNTTAGSAAAAVGTLSSLTTTDKSSAVAAINEVNNDLGQMSFRVNQGEAEYSTDGGVTWTSFSSGGITTNTDSGTKVVQNGGYIILDITVDDLVTASSLVYSGSSETIMTNVQAVGSEVRLYGRWANTQGLITNVAGENINYSVTYLSF